MCARVVVKILGCKLLKDCHADIAPVMPNYKNRMPRLPINRDFFSNRYAARKGIASFPSPLTSPRPANVD